MSISNSSMIHIGGGSTLNNVGRDQINHITHSITAQVVHIHDTTTGTSEGEDYNEFQTIRRGDMYVVKKVVSNEVEDLVWNKTQGGSKRTFLRGERTIHTVEVQGKAAVRFTAVSYGGQDAHKLWKKDFTACSRLQDHTAAQLFGINRSSIPSLIFYNGLSVLELWLDVSTGNLITPGHDQPDLNVSLPLFQDYQNYKFGRPLTASTPTTMDMLKKETALKFFQSHKDRFDYAVVSHAEMLREYVRECPCDKSHPEFTKCVLRLLRPHDLLNRSIYRRIHHGLRFDTVYSRLGMEIARHPSYPDANTMRASRGLVDGKQMEVEGRILTRFTFQPDDSGNGVEVKFASWNNGVFAAQTWLAQASRVFNALPAPVRLEDYFTLSMPAITLESISQKKLPPPPKTLYLFVYPLPYPLTDRGLEIWRNGRTHFWSFDEAGKIEFPEYDWFAECFGVYALAPNIHERVERAHSWSSYVYDALHDWQIARGFNPKTTDFARSLGYPDLEILQGKQEKDKRKKNSFWETTFGSSTAC
ncbi:hypothetical protein WG66_003936 [Moniliophthora roreri]|nr:hypothetical protein WG66_003936 [Moniliophthora roreri]